MGEESVGGVEKDTVENVEQMEEEVNGNPDGDKLEETLEVEKMEGSDDQEGVSSCHTIPSVGERKAERPVQEQTAQVKEKVCPMKKSIATNIPRGKPKSGRVWKENKKRFSDMVKDRPLRTSWEMKMKGRQEKKLVKGLAQQIKDEKQREKEEKRKRREENLRRRLE
ncbi:unnamed protein product, partial [Staurois parvus]